MASVQLYDITVPLFSRQLKNLLAVLEKSEQWCKDNGKPESYLTEASLAPDMRDLPFQIKNATIMARNGIITPSYEYIFPPTVQEYEKDFSGMRKRIQGVIELLDAQQPSEDTELGQSEMSFSTDGGMSFKCKSAASLLANVVLPNFWFHVVTAYDICRNKGVPLGKWDYMMSAGPFE